MGDTLIIVLIVYLCVGTILNALRIVNEVRKW